MPPQANIKGVLMLLAAANWTCSSVCRCKVYNGKSLLRHFFILFYFLLKIYKIFKIKVSNLAKKY